MLAAASVSCRDMNPWPSWKNWSLSEFGVKTPLHALEPPPLVRYWIGLPMKKHCEGDRNTPSITIHVEEASIWYFTCLCCWCAPGSDHAHWRRDRRHCPVISARSGLGTSKAALCVRIRKQTYLEDWQKQSEKLRCVTMITNTSHRVVTNHNLPWCCGFFQCSIQILMTYLQVFNKKLHRYVWLQQFADIPYLQEIWDVVFARCDFSPVIVMILWVGPIRFHKGSCVHEEEVYDFWWHRNNHKKDTSTGCSTNSSLDFTCIKDEVSQAEPSAIDIPKNRTQLC